MIAENLKKVNKFLLKTNIVGLSRKLYSLLFLTTLLLIFFYIRHEPKSDEYSINEKRIERLKILENKLAINEDFTQIKDLWVVLTTTREPTKEIDYLSRLKNVKVLVVGLETANPSWSHPNTIYLSIQKQESLGYGITQFIPKNSYSRKMIGYLYAIQHGAKFIYDTDDHVQLLKPLTSHFNFNEAGYGLTIKRYYTDLIMFNPFEHFGQVNMWPRGLFPNILKGKIGNDYINSKHKTSYIQHGLIKGFNADVDNIFRTTKDGNYKEVDVNFDEIAPPVELPLNVYAPYSSKNTLFHYEAFWSLYLPLSVPERYSDIYRSFWGQRLLWLFDGTVSHHGPNANSTKDFRSDYTDRFREDEEYRVKCENMIRLFYGWACWKLSFYECALELLDIMVTAQYILDPSESTWIRHWFDDLNKIRYDEPGEMTDMTIQPNYATDVFSTFYVARVQDNIDVDSRCCPDRKYETLRKQDSFLFFQNFCKNLPFPLKSANNRAHY